MKRYILVLALFAGLGLLWSCASDAEMRWKEGRWQLISQSGKTTVYLDSTMVFPELIAAYRLDSVVKTSDYTGHAARRYEIEDELGKGVCYEVEHTRSGLPDLVQRFYFYPGKTCFFTEIELVGDALLACGYMAPVKTTGTPAFLQEQGQFLFVPFDNDCWVKYDVRPLAGEQLSYEVSALFQPRSRRGLIVGSVEHDAWKTGVRSQTDQAGSVNGVECFGGVTSALTRDTLQHGKLKGKTVKSPKVMVGIFDDWRTGMEEYALANARIAPAPEWKQGTPFGWNSWGSIQQHINFDKAIQVSDFFKENLQDQGFSNDSTLYIDLDSFWDNFSDEQLKEFVDHCHRNGQKAGIYWVPFTDWFRDPERKVEGTDTPYREVYLYANGKEQSLDGAWAIDPTHPAVKKRIDYFTERFHRAGFEYIKIDFLTHGAMEADSHADPNVTTGIQAYNQGMKYLLDAFKGKFYITQAISPVFPSHYAHSRRIACDAFAAITDSEYTLNGLSYGWWLCNAYRFNDADHLLMFREGITEGENRARVTSGVITGIYMNGDDLTLAGPKVAKERVKKFFTNAEINRIARIGRSFRPVYGYRPTANGRAENFFVLEQEQVVYVVAFNFAKVRPLEYTLAFSDLNLDPARTYSATELWSGVNEEFTMELKGQVPPADVQVWKIKKL